MFCFNSAQLIGNVGKIYPFSKTSSGITVINFTIATNEKIGDKENTYWHRIKAFGGLADVIKDKLEPGARLFVSGVIETKNMGTREEPKWNTDIRAREIVLLE